MKPRGTVRSHELVAAVLDGQLAAIARLMTRVENDVAEALPALERLYEHTGKAHIVGLTGVPGSGKSTLMARLVPLLRSSGRRVGVVAVDPTSPYSGGSILGDRIRMTEVSADPGVFVRSMATRGALGGLAAATLDAVDILDAAGYDPVFIETVGVGQDEVDVVSASHTTVVVNAPGLGDDIQAVKAGVLEIADIHVVSKCDRSDANRTVADLKSMLVLNPVHPQAEDWTVKVLATSAETGEGVDELLDRIGEHLSHLQQRDQLGLRQRAIAERRLLKAADELVRAQFHRHLAGGGRESPGAELLNSVVARTIHPHTAALQLFERVRRTELQKGLSKEQER